MGTEINCHNLVDGQEGDYVLITLMTETLQQAIDDAYGERACVLSFQPALATPALSDLNRLIARYFQQPHSGGRLYLESLVTLITVHIVQAATAPRRHPVRGPQHLTPQRLDRIRQYVDAHLTAPLSLQDMATVVDLSPYHFARSFKQTTGQAPYRYVLERRLARAKMLLTETAMPISRIAVEMGFTSQSHMTHAFRRLLGVPPKVFRNRP